MSQHTELRLELTKNLKWNGLLGVWLIKPHELIGLIERAADALQALERVQVDLGEAQDDSKVICPNCCTQFRAIPVAVQDKLRALERVPMTEEVALKIAHRRATTYTHRSDPHYSGYAFVPYTLMDFVRDLEAHHGITPPESK